MHGTDSCTLPFTAYTGYGSIQHECVLNVVVILQLVEQLDGDPPPEWPPTVTAAVIGTLHQTDANGKMVAFPLRCANTLSRNPDTHLVTISVGIKRLAIPHIDQSSRTGVVWNVGGFVLTPSGIVAKSELIGDYMVSSSVITGGVIMS